MGLVFVPLSTVSFATLPAHLRTDGAAILTLVRNIGSAIGIPVVIATLVHSTSVNHAQFIEHLTPFNDAIKNPDFSRTFDITTDAGRVIIDNLVTQQSMIIGFQNAFMLLAILAL